MFEFARRKLRNVYFNYVLSAGFVGVPSVFYFSLNGYVDQTIHVFVATFVVLFGLVYRYEKARKELDELEEIWQTVDIPVSNDYSEGKGGIHD